MKHKAAAAAAAAQQQRNTQSEAAATKASQHNPQADEVRAAEAQVNLQKALDALAKLRDTIDRRPGRLFYDA